MQTTIFLYAALLSAVSFVAGESSSTTTTKAPTPSQSSKAVVELNSFLSDLRGKPEFATFSSFLVSTAIPAKVTDIKDAVPTVTAVPEFTGLPKDAQNYFSSVYNAEQSVISKALSGAAPQPTGMLMAAGAAAAGVLGVAAMM